MLSSISSFREYTRKKVTGMDVGIMAIEARGDAYEFGRKQAEALQETPLFNRHVKRRKKSIRRYSTDVQETEKWVKSLSPALWEEMHGLAEGLEWRLWDIIHEYGGYQQSWKKSGCSALMKNGIYGRNYDYHPKTYDGRFVLWQPEKGYAHIGFAQRIIGRMDGMNEHGLALGYHFVNRISPEDGFICCSIARFILDSCRNVQEASELLQELPHRHSFNYSMTDARGTSAVVEGSAKGAVILNNDEGVCTNHFRSADKLKENRHKIIESTARMEKLVKYRKQSENAGDIYRILNDLDKGIAKTDYGNWSGTIHSAVYDTRSLQVLAGIGPDAKPAAVSFSDWLKGERFRIKKLRGRISHTEEAGHLESARGKQRN
jgi:predicted choloylglycine hydrolase